MKITKANYEAYREGFLSGMRIDKAYPQTLMVAGYKFEQILELVLKDQEEKAMGMTRKEAISKCHGIAYPETLIQALEALGLLKLDKKIAEYYRANTETYGVIKVEEWPEGLVIWVGEKIVYKSFEE